METYNSNKNFKDFVDKYCTKHEISVEEALKHFIVREVEKTYKEKQK